MQLTPFLANENMCRILDSVSMHKTYGNQLTDESNYSFLNNMKNSMRSVVSRDEIQRFHNT